MVFGLNVRAIDKAHTYSNNNNRSACVNDFFARGGVGGEEKGVFDVCPWYCRKIIIFLTVCIQKTRDASHLSSKWASAGHSTNEVHCFKAQVKRFYRLSLFAAHTCSSENVSCAAFLAIFTRSIASMYVIYLEELYSRHIAIRKNLFVLHMFRLPEGGDDAVCFLSL